MKKASIVKWAAGVLFMTALFAAGIPANLSAEEEFVIQDGTLIKYNGNGGNVVIPDGVTVIADGVFKETDIISVEIPEGVQVIGEYAFAYCDSLENVEFPSMLISIEHGAFLAMKS